MNKTMSNENLMVRVVESDKNIHVEYNSNYIKCFIYEYNTNPPFFKYDVIIEKKNKIQKLDFKIKYFNFVNVSVKNPFICGDCVNIYVHVINDFLTPFCVCNLKNLIKYIHYLFIIWKTLFTLNVYIYFLKKADSSTIQINGRELFENYLINNRILGLLDLPENFNCVFKDGYFVYKPDVKIHIKMGINENEGEIDVDNTIFLEKWLEKKINDYIYFKRDDIYSNKITIYSNNPDLNLRFVIITIGDQIYKFYGEQKELVSFPLVTQTSSKLKLKSDDVFINFTESGLKNNAHILNIFRRENNFITAVHKIDSLRFTLPTSMFTLKFVDENEADLNICNFYIVFQILYP